MLAGGGGGRLGKGRTISKAGNGCEPAGAWLGTVPQDPGRERSTWAAWPTDANAPSRLGQNPVAQLGMKVQSFLSSWGRWDLNLKHIHSEWYGLKKTEPFSNVRAEEGPPCL